jgi:hypothetical protein
LQNTLAFRYSLVACSICLAGDDDAEALAWPYPHLHLDRQGRPCCRFARNSEEKEPEVVVGHTTSVQVGGMAMALLVAVIVFEAI